jgi:hypothetical protein
MATVKIQLPPTAFIPAASNGPQFRCVSGTNAPIVSLSFDGATNETAYTALRAASYGSGNLTLTINWYADSGTTGSVVWEAAIAAITPDTDAVDIEGASFDYATAATVTDAHLGSQAQRPQTCAITISSLDSLAANDYVMLKIARLATDGADDMTGVDAQMIWAELSYSDA